MFAMQAGYFLAPTKSPSCFDEGLDLVRLIFAEQMLSAKKT